LTQNLIKANLNIYVAGIGCCKQEILASIGPVYDISRFGVRFVSFPEDADVLIFQGFYNQQNLVRFLEIYKRMVKPNWVIAYGKCAIENVNNLSSNDIFSEFSKEIKFDVFAPGCPPRPEAFIYSILRLIEKP